MTDRLRLAIQKSGRLSDHSKELLARAGIVCEWRSGRLDCRALDFPLDVMLVRDDDIPQYVAEGVCDLGIVGDNVLSESLEARGQGDKISRLKRLDFGHCRLAIAVPTHSGIKSVEDLAGKRIATSYPESLRAYLGRYGLSAQIIEIGGSVEVTPALGVADAICDLVSSGSTLISNGLKELATVYHTEAVLVRTAGQLSSAKVAVLERFMVRLSGVLRAERAKYIMMNAPTDAVETIRTLIPGLEEPTVMPLAGNRHRVALHAVAPEPIFWETMEKLKAAGASSILVVPIEKIIE